MGGTEGTQIKWVDMVGWRVKRYFGCGGREGVVMKEGG